MSGFRERYVTLPNCEHLVFLMKTNKILVKTYFMTHFGCFARGNLRQHDERVVWSRSSLQHKVALYIVSKLPCTRSFTDGFKSDINIYFYIDIFDTIIRKRSSEPKDAKGIFGSVASTQLYDHLIVHLTVSQKKTNLGKCYCTALILGPGANRKRVLHKYVSFPLNWEKNEIWS